MPTPKEAAAKLLASKEALVLCKKALMPKGTAHPPIAETDEDVHGGVVIDRQAYYRAMDALARYEQGVDALGGKNAADREESPEDRCIGDEAALHAALTDLEV